MHLAPGTRVGRYEIRAPLGAGGMGEVWSAYDRELEREVAIKFIRDGTGDVHRFIQEAKAASALNHPNVATVYEIGSHEDVRFIAMERVPGETLRDRLAQGPIPAQETLELALQIASALAAAHKSGIIHRDVKPENIIIRPDGYAKVLDFGLAKLRAARGSGTVVKTATGVAMGTVGYMAPEQFSGGEITPAADVFSLGVVLYEMVNGYRPGEGTRRYTLPKLDAIITRSLEKDPHDRYPSAVEMHEELRRISREQRAPAAVAPAMKTMFLWLAAAIVIVALGVGVWVARRAREAEQARQMIARAEKAWREHRVPEAYDLVTRAAAVVPDDERLPDLLSALTQRVTIKTNPPGATIYMQRFKGPAERSRVGVSPLELPRLMRADYIVTAEKDGYTPVTRPLSIAPMFLRASTTELARMPGTLQIQLTEAAKTPPNMVLVAGGTYKLQAWYRASDRAVNLPDYFIDRYEVSNADFARFVRDGGYRRRELWPDLPGGFDAAVSHLRDSTGLPGPRTWVNGAPPAGRENHPVTDITWYEAAAFARWAGKRLPTIFEWEKAGRYPGTRGPVTSFPWGFVEEGVDVTERANFLGKGTVEVGGMIFGMSTWGAQHMAGNVSEWLRNVKPPGHAARGGSWNDATYAFGLTAAFPPMYSSSTLGFRCVKETNPAADTGDFDLAEKPETPVYHPVDDREFAKFAKNYEYAKTPLNARVVESRVTPDWQRDKIAYDVNGKTVIAYLYLPRGFKPPFQVIHFAPAGDVEAGLRSLRASIENKLAADIRSGRAIFSVAMEGYIDRPRTGEADVPDSGSSAYVDYIVSRVTEQRRGLDYLETRPDIDAKRVAFQADSAGTDAGVILCAVEHRYRSILFVGSGIGRTEVIDIPAASRINFLPHMEGPKLMMQGRYDESSPYDTEFLPLYRLLREPKRALLYEGPHVPPTELYVRERQKWFDETLGPVAN